MGVPSKDLPFPAILGQQIFPLRWILPFKAVTADFEQRGGRVASGLFVSPGEAVESHHGILGKAKEKDANIIHFETGKWLEQTCTKTMLLKSKIWCFFLQKTLVNYSMVLATHLGCAIVQICDLGLKSFVENSHLFACNSTWTVHRKWRLTTKCH